MLACDTDAMYVGINTDAGETVVCFTRKHTLRPRSKLRLRPPCVHVVVSHFSSRSKRHKRDKNVHQASYPHCLRPAKKLVNVIALTSVTAHHSRGQGHHIETYASMVLRWWRKVVNESSLARLKYVSSLRNMFLARTLRTRLRMSVLVANSVAAVRLGPRKNNTTSRQILPPRRTNGTMKRQSLK